MKKTDFLVIRKFMKKFNKTIKNKNCSSSKRLKRKHKMVYQNGYSSKKKNRRTFQKNKRNYKRKNKRNYKRK